MNYEKLGVFYLGRMCDPAAAHAREDLLLYDSKDLVTHAACFGMTGSGKTGLGIVLLEEAAIDGVPAIIVDPKGDLSNLLLTFPELRGEDFAPWIAEGAAASQGLTPEAYAARQAELWRRGLAESRQDPDRIRRLRAAADFAIYTPGSEAGLPVSVLKSFGAPDPAVREDGELLRERLQATVTSLLGLMGIAADPVRSREHILLSLILERAWREDRGFDLEALILAVQNPGTDRIGVLDLESFYPARERFQLALTLNNLLAAPGFQNWLQGEPLDIDRLLYGPDGRPRHAIFSIAHLSDPERMFFVSMLLNQLVGWMRRQAGTPSLRALFHMDETAGYLPPVAAPPSKAPLMTLLKQARAFGLGIVLATQNPKDIDYKAMSNMGAWFVGRLQTDLDQERVLDGLQGAAAGAGREFNRAEAAATIAGLGKRVFLLYNVHAEAPAVFQTRWALSYLPGPLKREQIKRLTAVRRAGTAPAPVSVAPAAPAIAKRPVLPPDIAEYFVPPSAPAPSGARLVYAPALAAFAEVGFSDARWNVAAVERVAYVAPFRSPAAPVDWSDAAPLTIGRADLESEPREDAEFDDLPGAACKPRSYPVWSRALTQYIFMTLRVKLLRSPSLKAVSRSGENERDFRIRLEMAAREERDRLKDQLRAKHESRLRTLQDRIRRAQAAVERESEQASQRKVDTAIRVGATLLGALFGRKAASRSTVAGAGSAMRTLSRAGKEAADVRRAQESLEVLEQQLRELENEIEVEARSIEDRVDPRVEALETVEVRPKKTDISVALLALAWLPHWKDVQGRRIPAW